MENEAIEPIFKLIGTDFAVAVRKGDSDRQRKLNALLIALEHAYPDEMKELRGDPLAGRSALDRL